MTTELEKQFFDTFRIKYCGCESPEAQLRYKCGLSYPIKKQCYEITDKQYLELIVLHNIYLETRLYHLDVEDLKKEILQDLIDEQHLREIKKDDISDDMIHQVQAIFKGER